METTPKASPILIRNISCPACTRTTTECIYLTETGELYMQFLWHLDRTNTRPNMQSDAQPDAQPNPNILPFTPVARFKPQLICVACFNFEKVLAKHFEAIISPHWAFSPDELYRIRQLNPLKSNQFIIQPTDKQLTVAMRIYQDSIHQNPITPGNTLPANYNATIKLTAPEHALMEIFFSIARSPNNPDFGKARQGELKNRSRQKVIFKHDKSLEKDKLLNNTIETLVRRGILTMYGNYTIEFPQRGRRGIWYTSPIDSETLYELVKINTK